jgi:maleate isomerase
MDAIVDTKPGTGAPSAPRARVGLIIPSVNRTSEQQFNFYAPPGLAIHVGRAPITGPWRRPIAEMKDEIARVAETIADAGPDLIVYHCTDSSMRDGLDGERQIVEIVSAATKLPALSTSALVAEAMRAMRLAAVAVVSPDLSNDVIIRYLNACGIKVPVDVALKLNPRDSADVTPARWLEETVKAARDDVDGYFLSCTNTTQIAAIEDIELALGKPVINSNQAVLWGCLKRLADKLGPVAPDARLGRLMAA